MNATELNSRILDAWSRGDGQLLAELYSEAGNSLLDSGLENEGCFYLTQAYILALENGLDSAAALHAKLVKHGSEE